MNFPFYCCQKCGENIGIVGRFIFFGLFHKCKKCKKWDGRI